MLNQLSGQSEKDLFLYVNAASVWLNFLNTRDEFRYGVNNPAPMQPEYDQLFNAMMSLSDKIRAARNCPEIAFIIGDPSELQPVLHERSKN